MMIFTRRVFFGVFFMIFAMSCFLSAQKRMFIKRTPASTESNSSQLNDKERNALYKKTKTQLKSAREQYKKQCARLVELLVVADDLGIGHEESEYVTRDLRSFFNSLGDAYTSVVDTITGNGGLKQRIAELELANERLKKIIMAQASQLKEGFEREQKLASELTQKQVEYDSCKENTARLNSENDKLIDFLDQLKIVSDQIVERHKLCVAEKMLVQKSLDILMNNQ